MSYVKETFDAQNLEHAKDIVLSPDPARPNKFAEETQYLVDFIAGQNLLTSNSKVLDFGCGMGRVAKKLIEIFNCQVVGVDISARMLLFARQYVASDKFNAAFAYDHNDIDLALAIFVLQHTENPQKEVANLAQAVKPGGALLLVDDGKRFVPSGVDSQGYVVWQEDGVRVVDLVSEHFTNKGHFNYPGRDEKIVSLWRKK